MNYRYGRPRGTMRSTRERSDPRKFASGYGLVAWIWADRGITLGGTLRAEGAAPPVVTITGTLAQGLGVYIEIDGAGARGTATFKWSIDNGSTFVATGVLTAATVSLGSTGIVANFPVGAYATDNIYRATVASAADQGAAGNNATQATASFQVNYSVAGFGGLPCFDWVDVNTARGLGIANVTLGAHSIVATMRGDANAGYLCVHATDATTDGRYVFCTNGASLAVARSTVSSRKNVGLTWLCDSVRRTVAVTYGGTHATHLAYRNAVLDSTSDVAANDPGTADVTGTFYIGRNQVGAGPFRSVMREMMVFSSALPANVVTRLHAGQVARSQGAL